MTTVGKSLLAPNLSASGKLRFCSPSVCWLSVQKGYGNQSPVTWQGRGLVSGLGWLSIALFGGISLLAGSVMATVSDDFFKKCKLGFLTRPWAGVLLWAINFVLWLLIQSNIGYHWWKDRTLQVTFTREDSMWWSYISSTSVGLGDFFLAPESMFTVNVFSWSLVFLVGFVTLTTFLNKVTSLMGDFSSNTTRLLKERLARTDPFTSKVLQYHRRNKDALRDIDALVNMLDETNRPEDMVDITVRKREILIRLLQQTERELEALSKFGSTMPSTQREEEMLVEEEKILSQTLERINHERRSLKESRRSCQRVESSLRT
jgi:hypothetical protein